MEIKKILKSKYETKELKQNLELVTENYHSFSKNIYLFEGKIDESKFQISPVFDIGNHKNEKIWNQLEVEINGELVKKENSRHCPEFCVNRFKMGLTVFTVEPFFQI